MASHAGAARFAYSTGLAHVKEAIGGGEPADWSRYSLRRWWNKSKGALAVNRDAGVAWWGQNSKEAYSMGLRSLARGLSNWARSRKGRRKGRRVGFPRFKSESNVAKFAYSTGFTAPKDSGPYGLRLPAYWPGTLRGERVQADEWRSPYPHKRVASGRVLVCEFDRGA